VDNYSQTVLVGTSVTASDPRFRSQIGRYASYNRPLNSWHGMSGHPSLTDVGMHQYEDIQVLTVEEAKLELGKARWARAVKTGQ